MSLNADIHTIATDSADHVYVASVGMMQYSSFVAALVKDMKSPVLDKLHAAVGIAGEAGELVDAIKKHWAYEKGLDVSNVVEELGDLEFYMTAMRMCIGVSRDVVLQNNATKLEARYKKLEYSDEAAVLRADKVATGETAGSYLTEEGPKAINLSSAQVAAVDETAGIVMFEPEAATPESVQSSQELQQQTGSGNLSVQSLP